MQLEVFELLGYPQQEPLFLLALMSGCLLATVACLSSERPVLPHARPFNPEELPRVEHAIKLTLADDRVQTFYPLCRCRLRSHVR
jgi:hypothetical protein